MHLHKAWITLNKKQNLNRLCRNPFLQSESFALSKAYQLPCRRGLLQGH
jgi:hypothetical protein